MTVQELLLREQKKFKNREIGDAIALKVLQNDEEVYFEDCFNAEGDFEYWEEFEVRSYSYVQNYGDLKGKLLLVVEI